MAPDEHNFLSEPDKKHQGHLRSGFTTGTAATAAAIAATQILTGEAASSTVEVQLPAGDFMTITISEAYQLNLDEALAIVIKDAGDDPDVTNKAEIGAIVRRRSTKGLLHLIGGSGVGKVTKPGLALPPGQWAINPGPRAMLDANLRPFLDRHNFGLEVEIFVEKGSKLAEKTMNPRLGIVGGISILGSTGRVKPFSHQAYIATIEAGLDVAKAAGLAEIVFTTGRQSEILIRKQRPELPAEAFVQIADFFADSLRLAAEKKFQTIGLASFFGKAVKQATGLENTHAHRHDQNPALLAQWLNITEPGLIKSLDESLTARAALEAIKETDNWAERIKPLAPKVLDSAAVFAGTELKLWTTIFDYDGSELLSAARLQSK